MVNRAADGRGAPQPIERVAFWALLPALVLSSVAIGWIMDVAGNAPGQKMFGGILMFFAAIVLFVALIAMTAQALLLVRRPQSLTERAIPIRIAVPQLALYGVISLWVLLLVSLDIAVLSWIFVGAIIALMVLLTRRMRAWPAAPSVAPSSVALPLGLRLALTAYTLLAIAGGVYLVLAILDPTIDPDGLRPLLVLLALGLPTSLVVVPIALISEVVPLALLGIAVNVVAAQLLIWSPRRLVTWLFRLGKGEEPATTVTGSSL